MRLLNLIWLSPTFVCDFFSVNLLSYDGEKFECHDDRFTVNEIIDQIKTKHGYIMQNFKRVDDYYYKFDNRLKSLKERGYTMEPLSDRGPKKVKSEYIFNGSKDRY